MQVSNSITKSCEICKKQFTILASVKKGWGRFCSKTCMGIGRRVPIEDRFFAKISKHVESNGCLLWLASCDTGGYGTIKHQGKNAKASRIAYQFAYGDFDQSLFVLHHCDNPPCVNPLHLFLGTHQDNATDKVEKGRQSKGVRSITAKLTDDQVREIRALYVPWFVTQKQLAKRFGIAEVTVNNIIHKRDWKHID